MTITCGILSLHWDLTVTNTIVVADLRQNVALVKTLQECDMLNTKAFCDSNFIILAASRTFKQSWFKVTLSWGISSMQSYLDSTLIQVCIELKTETYISNSRFNSTITECMTQAFNLQI